MIVPIYEENTIEVEEENTLVTTREERMVELD